MVRNKLLVIVAVLILAFAFIACEKSNDEGKGKGNVKGKMIDVRGGEASDTVGGDGGGIYIDWSGAGGVKFLREGDIDTSFDLPKYPENFDCGDVCLEVDVDGPTTVVNVYIDDIDVGKPAVATGEYHLHYDSLPVIYRFDGVEDEVVTGLIIEKGAKLTLGLNSVPPLGSCYTAANVMFTNDVKILGTLTVMDLTTAYGEGTVLRHGLPATAKDKGSLILAANQLFIGKNGLVTAGGDNAGDGQGRGGDGGGLVLQGFSGVFSDGDLDCAGGDSADSVGGNGCVMSEFPTPSKSMMQPMPIFFSGAALISSMGVLENTGDIYASGGDSADSTGGDAGDVVELLAGTMLWNTGDLYANGGNGGAAGNGGDGGEVILQTGFGVTSKPGDKSVTGPGGMGGSIWNRGDLYSNGGDGGLGGGNSNEILIGAGGMVPRKPSDKAAVAFGVPIGMGGMGNIVNSGDLEMNGGDALSDGRGGYAGEAFFSCSGGMIKTDGRIEGIGGDGTDSADSVGGGVGGGGGVLYFVMSFGSLGYDIPKNADINGDSIIDTYGDKNHGDLTVANNIILTGGNGASGGDGGIVVVDDWASSVGDPMPATARFIGFNLFDLNGGGGPTGGDGGEFGVETYSAYIAGANQPTGPIVNRVDVEANGGDSADSIGGDGGELYFDTVGTEFDKLAANDSDLDTTIWEGTYVVNSGSVELNGGAADSVGGGDGGEAYMFGYYFSKNSGRIVANGGEGTGLQSSGGNGGFIELISPFKAVNLGSLKVNGGDGVVFGGDAGGTMGIPPITKDQKDGLFGGVELNGGERAINTGNIDAIGGAADSVGGDGGVVYLTGQTHKSINTGTIDVRGGKALTDGLIGHIYFDLIDVTPDDGTIGF